MRLGQTMQGHPEKGIAQLKEGLAAWRANGSRFLVPYYLYALADAHRRVGQVEEALSVIADALAAVEDTEERWCEAELHRLKGELSLKASPVEAEACFQRAIASARRHDAKSWELRAVTSLSRLWREQGKKEQAREMLAKIYAWFTEGFDTADLKAAKALLEELSAGGGSPTIGRTPPRRRILIRWHPTLLVPTVQLGSLQVLHLARAIVHAAIGFARSAFEHIELKRMVSAATCADVGVLPTQRHRRVFFH